MYSQHAEEQHILEIFTIRGCIQMGTFLDVGAWNGKLLSNTYRLTELGWSGVLVEPSPGPFRALLELHGKNPQLHLVNAAVAPLDSPDLMRFYVTDDAVSTSVEDFKRVWASAVDYRPIYVKPLAARSLAQFCEDKLGPLCIDLVSVDTEGSSFEIAQALYAALKIKPRAWCVEYATQYRSYAADFKALFKDYRLVYTSEENLLFARDF